MSLVRELATRMPRIGCAIPGVNSHHKTVGSVTQGDTKSRSRKYARTSILGEIRGSTRPTAAHFNASLIATCRVFKSRVSGRRRNRGASYTGCVITRANEHTGRSSKYNEENKAR